MIKTENKQEINIKLILQYLFIIAPFLQFRTYSEMPASWGLIDKYWCILSATIIYVLNFNSLIPIIRKTSLKWLALFWCIYIGTTVVHFASGIANVLYYSYTYFALCFFLFKILRIPQKRECLLTALAWGYGTLIFANFFTDVLIPNGLYRTSTYHSTHLLGDDNALIYVFLPGITCMGLQSLISKRRISSIVWLAIIASEYSLISVWSVSAMVVLALFIFLELYVLIKAPIPSKLLFGGVVFSIIISLFGLTNTYVSHFIEDYLEKDVTLTGRTILWMYAFDLISQNPLFGSGGYFANGRWFFGEVITSTANEYPCHTPFLQLLIDGGIVLFGVFTYIVFCGYWLYNKYKNQCTCILAIGLSCMLINYITEYAGLVHFFIVITLMLNSKYFYNIHV